MYLPIRLQNSVNISKPIWSGNIARDSERKETSWTESLSFWSLMSTNTGLSGEYKGNYVFFA